MATFSSTNAAESPGQKLASRVRSQKRRAAYSLGDVKTEDLANVHRDGESVSHGDDHRRQQKNSCKDKLQHREDGDVSPLSDSDSGSSVVLNLQTFSEKTSNAKVAVQHEEREVDDDDEDNDDYEEEEEEEEEKEEERTMVTVTASEHITSRHRTRQSPRGHTRDGHTRVDMMGQFSSAMDLLQNCNIPTELVAPVPSETFRASLVQNDILPDTIPSVYAPVKNLYPTEYDEKSGLYRGPMPAHKRLVNPKLRAIYESRPKSVPNGGYEIFLAPSERVRLGLPLLPGQNVQSSPRGSVSQQSNPRQSTPRVNTPRGSVQERSTWVEPLHWRPGPEVAVPRKSLCSVVPCRPDGNPSTHGPPSRHGPSGGGPSGRPGPPGRARRVCTPGCPAEEEHDFCGTDLTGGYSYYRRRSPAGDSIGHLEERSKFNISPYSADDPDLEEEDLGPDEESSPFKDPTFDPTPIRRTKAQIFSP